jgi:hypothetical protein
VKVRAAEEKKVKIETMYAQLQKSHQDLYNRYNEERENKLKAVDQLKDVCKEAGRERAEKLKEKNEKEKEKEKVRNSMNEDANRQSKISASAIERDRSGRFGDQNRHPNIIYNSNFNLKDQNNLQLSERILDLNSESGNNLAGSTVQGSSNLAGSTVQGSPSSDREQELSERNSLCRSLVSGSTFSSSTGPGANYVCMYCVCVVVCLFCVVVFMYVCVCCGIV